MLSFKSTNTLSNNTTMSSWANVTKTAPKSKAAIAAREAAAKETMKDAKAPIIDDAKAHIDDAKVPISEVAKVPIIEVAKAPIIEVAKAPIIEEVKAPIIEVTKAPIIEVAKAPITKSDKLMEKLNALKLEKQKRQELEDVIDSIASEKATIMYSAYEQIYKLTNPDIYEELAIKMYDFYYTYIHEKLHEKFYPLRLSVNIIDIYNYQVFDINDVNFVHNVEKEPVTEKSVTEKPVTEKSVTEEPVTEKPEPVTEKPEPVTEKPFTEKSEPVTEKSEPVTEKSEPVTEKSVTEEPVTDKPVTYMKAVTETKPDTEKPVTYMKAVTIKDTAIIINEEINDIDLNRALHDSKNENRWTSVNTHVKKNKVVTTHNDKYDKIKEFARKFASDIIYANYDDIYEDSRITINCDDVVLGKINEKFVIPSKFLDPSYVSIDQKRRSTSHMIFKHEFFDILNKKLGNDHGLHIRFDKDFDNEMEFHICFFKHFGRK